MKTSYYIDATFLLFLLNGLAVFPSTAEDTELIGYKEFTCILSPTAFAFGFDIFLDYESANQGMQWNDLSADPLSMGTVLAFLVFDTILYFILALYFELVLPNEYGSNLSLWFLCTRSYWYKTKSERAQKFDNDEPIPKQDNDYFEPIHHSGTDSRSLVSVRQLCKQWPYGSWFNRRTLMAVNRLNFDMLENCITCLLGHNG